MDKLLEIYRMDASEGILFFWAKEILVASLIFGLFWGVAQAVRFLLEKVAPRFTSFTKTDLDDRILQRITPPATFLVLATGLYVAIGTLPLPDKAKVIVSGLIFIVNIIILTNIAYRACDEILTWYAGRQSEKSDPALNRQLMPLVEKLVTIFLGTTALIITLKHFNYDILSLVTALGIGSLAIGMAAKDTLANMISGFTIMLDRPFRIGDRIQLTSGQFGDVVDIGLRSTKIKTPDNMFLIIPNSDLCNSTVINMAFPDVKASGKITLGVAYGSDIVAVKELLVETAAMIPDVLTEPAPAAFFTGFGDSGLNLALVFWVENYTMVFATTDKINTLLLHRLTERGITIPYPTRTVHIEKGE